MSETPKETPEQKLERLEAQYSELSKTVQETNAKLDASAAIMQKVVTYFQQFSQAQQTPPGQGAPGPAGQQAPPGQAPKFDLNNLSPFIDVAEKIITMVINAKSGLSAPPAIKADPVEELMLKRLHKNYMKNLVIKESLSDREIEQLIKSGKISKDTQALLKEIEEQA